MKIAICLYGQARKYRDGYIFLNDFMNKNNAHNFTIFFHTWYSTDQYYEASNYRNIDKKDLIIEPNLINNLKELYKPIDYCYNEPRDFDKKKIITSTMYTNCSPKEKQNLNNLLSNIYSKYKSYKILKQFCEKNNYSYDIVISIRFDYINNINLIIEKFETDKFITIKNNANNIYFINDNFVVCNYNNFKLYTSAYKNIEYIINNKNIENFCVDYYGNFTLVPEMFVTCNLIYNNINILEKIDYDTHNILNYI